MLDVEAVKAAVPAYEVGRVLGSGASGYVLAGRHRSLDRRVAIKVVLRSAESEHLGFSAEARVLAKLDHPHIVRLFDYVESATMHIIIMELLPGGMLTSRMHAGALSPETACAVALALAGALEAAHTNGILHRDVKPANVLFTEDGSPKMSDFGIAKLVDAEGAVTTRTVIGTPAYMAPEQVAGDRFGPASDLYSLGALLYELLTGAPVYGRTSSIAQLIQRKLFEAPPPMNDTVVPTAVADVVLRSLSRNPTERQSSARVFGAELAYAAAQAFAPTWLADTGVPVYLGEAVRSAVLDVTARLESQPIFPVVAVSVAPASEEVGLPGPAVGARSARDVGGVEGGVPPENHIIETMLPTRRGRTGPPTPKHTEAAKWENNFSGRST